VNLPRAFLALYANAQELMTAEATAGRAFRAWCDEPNPILKLDLKVKSQAASEVSAQKEWALSQYLRMLEASGLVASLRAEVRAQQ
jgi:hypothetical protein